MELKIEGKKFTVTGELEEYLSEKGNTVIASSHGNKPCAVTYKGKNEVVNVGLNMFIKKK